MFKHTNVTARLPTEYGLFTLHLFTHGEFEVPVLTQMERMTADLPLVRIHSSCVTGDIFHSLRCDCGAQLAQAMNMIQQQGGILIYLPQEGRGIGLKNKLKAYVLQDEQQLDTVEANLQLGLPADARDYQAAADILKFFKVQGCFLLTNNPLKVEALQACGLTVIREPLKILPNNENQGYLDVKMKKMGHLL